MDGAGPPALAKPSAGTPLPRLLGGKMRLSALQPVRQRTCKDCAWASITSALHGEGYGWRQSHPSISAVAPSPTADRSDDRPCNVQTHSQSSCPRKVQRFRLPPSVLTVQTAALRSRYSDFRLELGGHPGQAVHNLPAGQLQGAPQAFSSGDKHLEVVIATYDVDRLEESARTWERLLAIPKASLP